MIIGTNSAQEIVEFAPSPLSCDCGFSNHSKALASLLSGKNRTNICIYIPQCWMVVPFFTAIDSQWPQLNGLWKNRVKIFLNVLLFIATSIYRPCIGSIKWLFECAFWFMLVWISSVVNYCLCSAQTHTQAFDDVQAVGRNLTLQLSKQPIMWRLLQRRNMSEVSLQTYLIWRLMLYYSVWGIETFLKNVF